MPRGCGLALALAGLSSVRACVHLRRHVSATRGGQSWRAYVVIAGRPQPFAPWPAVCHWLGHCIDNGHRVGVYIENGQRVRTTRYFEGGGVQQQQPVCPFYCYWCRGWTCRRAPARLRTLGVGAPARDPAPSRGVMREALGRWRARVYNGLQHFQSKAFSDPALAAKAADRCGAAGRGGPSVCKPWGSHACPAMHAATETPVGQGIQCIAVCSRVVGHPARPHSATAGSSNSPNGTDGGGREAAREGARTAARGTGCHCEQRLGTRRAPPPPHTHRMAVRCIITP